MATSAETYMTGDFFKERVTVIVKEEISSYHRENISRFDRLEESVEALKTTIARWSGALVLLLGLILFEALFNGGCNKIHVSMGEVQHSSTTASDSSISQ